MRPPSVWPSTLAVALFLSPAPLLAAGSEDKRAWGEDAALFQASAFAPRAQLVSEQRDVKGLRVTAVYGKNENVSGLDLGLGVTEARNFSGLQITGVKNNVSGEMVGVQIAVLANEARSATGIQIGGLGNAVTAEMTGVQIGLWNMLIGSSFTGLQIGAINFPWGSSFTRPTRSVTGVQIGYLNYGGEELKGVQIGLANGAESSKSVQIGLLNGATNCAGLMIGVVNICDDMFGVQIGVVNWIDKSPVKLLPLVNAKF